VRRLTPGRVATAVHCTAFLSLDWKDKPSSGRKVGLAFHAATTHLTAGPNWALIREQTKATEKMIAQARDRWQRWIYWANMNNIPVGDVTTEHELCVAYEPATGKMQRFEIEPDARPPETPPGWLVTKIDMVSFTDRVHLWEWKTGYYVPPPQEHEQTKTGSLMLARLLDLAELDATIARISDTGPVYPMSATFDAFDLEEQDDKLLRIQDRMKRKLPPDPGGWCDSTTCPARLECPAYEGRLKRKRAA
jgi:hypothetical protein